MNTNYTNMKVLKENASNLFQDAVKRAEEKQKENDLRYVNGEISLLDPCHYNNLKEGFELVESEVKFLLNRMPQELRKQLLSAVELINVAVDITESITDKSEENKPPVVIQFPKGGGGSSR